MARHSYYIQGLGSFNKRRSGDYKLSFMFPDDTSSIAEPMAWIQIVVVWSVVLCPQGRSVGAGVPPP
jgi:hypothetical protein